MLRTTNDRIISALIGSLALFGLLAVRCFWLQVVDSPRYREMARAQHRTEEPLPAVRGAILDRYDRPLAVSVPAPSIYANARRVKEKTETAQQLARIVGQDAKRIKRRLEKDKGFVWIARQMTPEILPPVMEMSRSGIGVLEESKRIYPQGRLASHIIGFVDIDHRGLEGLELAYNGVLRGEGGWRSTLRDAKGSRLIGPWTTEVVPVDGLDLILTLDSVVQQVAEETLEWGVNKYHAKGGSIVVLDPKTGQVLGMANWPTYDANMPAKSKLEWHRNRSVTDLFEPGSTFKIVTAAALLEEGRITPDEKVFCEEGSYRTVGSHILHDHHPNGTLSFADVIKKSSNIGTAKSAQRLTPDELYGYIRAFGFGRRTGIELPGEVSGLLRPTQRWSKLTPFIVPIGQEIAVTPIQLAAMVATVANGGTWIQPSIVAQVRTSKGKVVRSFERRPSHRVISEQTSLVLQDILTGVVESGTGQLASVHGLTVAGKTGTAQKLEPNGRYSHSRFVASFVGFGPVPDPRFVIIVNVDEPRPLYFGGVVAAPMFKRLVEKLASYWGLTPASPIEVTRLPKAGTGDV